MNQKDFLDSCNVVLDLALEAHELLRGDAQKEIPGVKETQVQFPYGNVTTITILDAMGEKIMGKTLGTYITIEATRLRENSPEVQAGVAVVLAQQLRGLLDSLQIAPQATVLLVGLGNWEATPDALGPRVIDYSFVTRHMLQFAPGTLPPGTRPVCALAPGVLGLTGMETAEIIRGVVDRIQPQLIVAIDALAARNINRISTTIQLADTGINPGSGVGNQRAAITRQSMGIPVIAIGVPTVVHAAVIVYDVLNLMAAANPGFASGVNIKDAVARVLEPFQGNLTVTPKEIDDLIPSIATVIAQGIDQALHPPEFQKMAHYLQ